MITLKVSDELQASLGVETVEQLEALLTGAADAKVKLAGANKTNGELSQTITAFESRIARLETSLASVPRVDEARVRELAKAEASQEATRLNTEFMAKTGIKPLDTQPAGTEGGKKVDKFEDKVCAFMAEQKLSKGDAILKAVKEFPELHKDFVNRGGKV